MKRVLIKQDENLLNEMVSDLRGFRPALTALKNAYSELQMGPFNKEAFSDIVKNGFSNVYAKYTTNLESELDKTGVKNPILRKTVLSASEPVFDKFRKAYSDLMDYSPVPSRFNTRPMLQLSQISFNSEVFEVSAEDQEVILEQHCRVYLESEAEKAFHSTLTNLRDALNAYLKDFEDYELDGKANGYCGLDTFLRVDGFNASIIAENISYGVTAAGVSKKYNEKRCDAIRQKTERAAETLSKFRSGELDGQIVWTTQLNQTENLIN